ncbi:MAG: serine/threonine-protein kinase [Myxococcota bacterium]
MTGDLTSSAELARTESPEVVADAEPDVLRRGELIGHFTIIDRLGAGGMGVVYAAYDVELNRKVAIKLLRLAPGQDQSIGRARLLREAQAMAQVDHPNVVRVFEVGNHRGDVYIAMEFIDGETFGAWRRRTGAGWQEVVDVLERAARGLVAAHAEGLVHRDFKPDNVMVGRDGRVRVMDFGLVRSDGESDSDAPLSDEDAESDVTSSVALTEAGSVVGTPAYMAPEQFERRSTDARTDQFSFCVALWEALFDERPFEGNSILTLGMNVTEGIRKPPPKGIRVPAWLLRVCERGLSTKSTARFDSMRVLLEAIEAGRRRSKRRWLALGAATVLLGATGLWAVKEVSERRRVRSCEVAGQAIDEVWNDEVAGRLHSAFEPLGPDAATRTIASATGLLDDRAEGWSAARTQSCLRNADDLQARATWCLEDHKQTLAATLDAVTNADDRAVLLQLVPALSELGDVDECLDEDALRGRTLPPSSERSVVAGLRTELAAVDALLLTAQFGEAVDAAQAMDARPDAGSWAPFHADLSLRLGRALSGRGDLDAAESRLVDGYLEAVDSQRADLASTIALELANLLGTQRQEPTRGMLWMRLAEVHERVRGETPLRRAGHLHRRASLLRQLTKFDEAEAEYLEAVRLLEAELGPRHLLAARTRNNLGNLYQELSRFDEAMAQFDAAIAIRREVLGEAHPDVAQTLIGKASALAAKGEHDGALSTYRRALAISRSALGDAHVLVAAAHQGVAAAHLDLRQLEPALEHATQAVAIYEAQFGPLHTKTATALNAIGTIHHRAGRLSEATAYYERARVGLEAALGPGHARVALVLFNLALIEQSAGRISHARGLFQRALSIRETIYGSSHHLVADTLEEFAILEAKQARLDEARVMFDRTLAIRREVLKAGHAKVWHAVTNLALLNSMREEPARSRALYADILNDWANALGEDDPALARPLLAAANLELGEGAPAAAIAPARRALALCNTPGRDAVERADARFTLAQALAPDPGKDASAESIELARASLLDYGESPAHREARDAVRAWLAARGAVDAG